MNLSDERLKNPKVREALRYLVDYQGMADTFLKGRSTCSRPSCRSASSARSTTTPTSLTSPRPRRCSPRPAIPTASRSSSTSSTNPPLTEICQSVQQTMGMAGIKVNIVPANASRSSATFRARQHQMVLISWAPDYLDPHTNADIFAMNDRRRRRQDEAARLAQSLVHPRASNETAAAAQGNRPEEARPDVCRPAEEDHARGPFIMMFQPPPRWRRGRT